MSNKTKRNKSFWDWLNLDLQYISLLSSVLLYSVYLSPKPS